MGHLIKYMTKSFVTDIVNTTELLKLYRHVNTVHKDLSFMWLSLDITNVIYSHASHAGSGMREIWLFFLAIRVLSNWNIWWKTMKLSYAWNNIVNTKQLKKCNVILCVCVLFGLLTLPRYIFICLSINTIALKFL